MKMKIIFEKISIIYDKLEAQFVNIFLQFQNTKINPVLMIFTIFMTSVVFGFQLMKISHFNVKIEEFEFRKSLSDINTDQILYSMPVRGYLTPTVLRKGNKQPKFLCFL